MNGARAVNPSVQTRPTRLAADRVLGPAVIDLPHALLLVTREGKERQFISRIESFGIQSGVVSYVASPALAGKLPPGLAARVNAAADSLKAGSLKALP